MNRRSDDRRPSLHTTAAAAAFLLLFSVCRHPTPPAEKADGTIRGRVLPGAAAGFTGPIYVTAATDNRINVIDWSKRSTILPNFGSFEISELKAGKYYLAAFLDVDKSGDFNAGDFWGGYDADGDGRLDPLTLVGGNTLTVDIALIDRRR